MAQVASDDRLGQDLVLKIAKENVRGIDLASYRTAISNACHVDSYLDVSSILYPENYPLVSQHRIEQ